MKPRHWLYLGLVALTLARFCCLGRFELTPPEAYHSLWSQHPDWCYDNQGPVLAMVIRVGIGFFGATEFGVRFFSPLLALGTCLFLLRLAHQLYGERVALWSVIVLNALPFFQSDSLLITSAGFSLFLWAAALFTFWRALEQSPRFSFYWPVTGLLIGAGFLTEYSHAIELLSVILILASTRKFRHELGRPTFWSLFILFSLFTIPVFWWNARHEWITWLSWRAQLMEAGIHPLRIFKYLGWTALACSPLLFAGIVMIVATRAFNKARRQFKPRFLLYYSLPLFGLELILSSSKSGSVDSTAPVLLGLVILSVAFYQQIAPSKRKEFFGVIALGLGLIQSVYSLDSLLKQSGHLSWKAVAAEVGELRKQTEKQSGKPVFLIGNDPETASILAFYLPNKQIEGVGHPPVYIPESQMIENQFSYWPRYDEFFISAKDVPPSDPSYQEEQGVNPFIGRTALFISTTEQIPTAILNSFERVTPPDPAIAGMQGIHIYQCVNYRSMQL